MICSNGIIISSITFLSKSLLMSSYPGVFLGLRSFTISMISFASVGIRNREFGFLFFKKESKDVWVCGMALARVGPIFEK